MLSLGVPLLCSCGIIALINLNRWYWRTGRHLEASKQQDHNVW